MIIIDGTNLLLGRMATVVAKKVLLGEEVRVLNADKVVISGSKSMVIEKITKQRNRGTPAKGPHLPKMADRFVRRTIRGMLPYKLTKGAEAYKRVLCYTGVPEEFKDATTITIEAANVSKLPTLKYVSVGEAIKNI